MKKMLMGWISLLLILGLTACAAAPQQSTTPQVPAQAAQTTQAQAAVSPTATASSMEGLPPGQLALSVINVGKGDAMLITTPGGSRYMVDTGKVEDYPRVVRALAALQVSRLDGIILTHGHKDHMGGLENLLAAYPVGRVYISALDTVTYKAGNVEALCAARNVPVEKLKTGDRLALDDAALTALGPNALNTQEENDNSMVMQLTYKDVKMLLMGDATGAIEQQLIASGIDLSAQVLKAGHHGKDDATGDAFIQAVAPQYVILTGDPAEDDNSPGQRVTRLLDEADITSFQTSGSFIAVSFYTDGQSVNWVEAAGLSEASPMTGLTLTAIDKKAESVTLRNDSGTTLDLSGCWLFSENGGEVFFFPQGTILTPRAQISVISGDLAQAGANDQQLIWTDDKVWKAKKSDAAMLFDAQGRLLAQLD